MAKHSGPLGFAPRQRNEFSVRKVNEALEKGRQIPHRAENDRTSKSSAIGSAASGKNSLEYKADEPTEVLASCLDNMKALWTDNAVKVVLRKRKILYKNRQGCECCIRFYLFCETSS